MQKFRYFCTIFRYTPIMLNPFAKKFTPKERSLFKFLRQTEIFYDLDDDELYEILPYLHLRKYAQNEVIFFRNDPSQALYLIKNGTVMLNMDIQDKFVPLMPIHTGSYFGDDALVEGSVRKYTAVSMSEACEVYVIPQVSLLDIFEDDLQIKAKVYEAFAREQNRYLAAIFKHYRDSFGFFDLGQAYQSVQREVSEYPLPPQS